MSFERQCREAAEALRAVAREHDRGGQGDIAVYAPKVIEALKGSNGVFWELDEKPGRWGGYRAPDGYAGTLRRVRNHPVWGKAMFASFREGS